MWYSTPTRKPIENLNFKQPLPSITTHPNAWIFYICILLFYASNQGFWILVLFSWGNNTCCSAASFTKGSVSVSQYSRRKVDFYFLQRNISTCVVFLDSSHTCVRAVQFVRQPQTTTSICQKMTNAFKSRRHQDRIPSGLEGSVCAKPHFNNFNSVYLIRFFLWKACMTLTPCVLRWREEIMDIKCMRRWNCTCRFVHYFQYIFRWYRQCFAKTTKAPKNQTRKQGYLSLF